MNFSFYLTSGTSEDDEEIQCKLQIGSRGIALPPLIKPKLVKQEFTYRTPRELTSYVERTGRDYYFKCIERRLGFSAFNAGSESPTFVQIWLGGNYGDDSCDDQTISLFLPWEEWRFVRSSYYGLNGELFADTKGRWKDYEAVGPSIPRRSFEFLDFDGEKVTATTYIEEREWRKGDGWFKWLSWFVAPKVRRALDIQFSAETGRRKGSWKGGTVGHGIDLLPGELHEDGFKRYCLKHEMTFLRVL